MREWLTVIIVLLIVAVLLDGARRMRQSRRSTIKMSRRVHQNSSASADNSEPESYGSELPNGGARVVTVRAPDGAQLRNNKIKQNARTPKTRGRSQRIPEQVTLNLDESVPMLMESVADEKTRVQSSSRNADTMRRTEEQHSLFNDPAPDATNEADDLGRIEPRISADFDEPATDDESNNDWVDSAVEPTSLTDGLEEEISSNTVAGTEEYADEIIEEDTSPDLNDHPEPYAEEVDDEEDGADVRYVEPEIVLVINVMAPKGVKFSGAALLDVVLAQGLRFGGMNIFHRHASERGDGNVLFSMANIVVPGTFDLSTMKAMITPGVSLFLALPLEGDEGDVPSSSLKAFELMLRTAKAIADTLDGELKDENRSVLTSQTIEHYRQRVRDFERKQLSRAPA